MIKFGRGGDIDLAGSASGFAKKYKAALQEQNKRADGICRRLYEAEAPGCLLADEVGKGKTYIALGVAFACLARKHNSRVLVLTHSREMARAWEDRWNYVKEKCVSREWRDRDWSAACYLGLQEIQSAVHNGGLPRIAFVSYETLKKFSSPRIAAALLLGALGSSKSIVRRVVKHTQKKHLVKQIIDCNLSGVTPQKCPKGSAKLILSGLDATRLEWKPRTASAIREELLRLQAKDVLRGCPRFDLLIIDEAHKLESDSRQHVIAHLFKKRFEKCLLVTATPFALSVEQFRRRLLDITHAHGVTADFETEIKDLPLKPFQEAVENRRPFPEKDDLEHKLRKYMIRDTWNLRQERTTEHWKIETGAQTLLPTLLLERVIDGVLQNGRRTHIASRRESLCSSWPAALKSFSDSPIKDTNRQWVDAFCASGVKAADKDPKLLEVARQLVELSVKQGHKAVVFTQRIETSAALAAILRCNDEVKILAQELKKQSARFHRYTDRIKNWLPSLEGSAHAAGIAKVMAHCAELKNLKKLRKADVERWWEDHKGRLNDWNTLESVVGRGKHLPIIVRYDSDSGTHERNHDKFNLPCSPLILIATPKAQEGIDLHHYCRHMVLLDLTWNPAAMEQRIGRVHRLGGILKPGEPVVVIYCFRKGTYEDVMAERVQRRCEMMRVLLGAGQWLDEDREVQDLDGYKMSFPAYQEPNP